MTPADQLSVQLWTVRRALTDDTDATLGRLAEIGFTLVEPFGLTDYADPLAAGFARYGLRAPTTHVRLLEGDPEPVFEIAQSLGVDTLVHPHSDPARWQAAADIEQLAAELNAVAEAAARFGLRVGYHNHQFELESRIEGRFGLEVLADALDPAVVLEVDTYWAYAGGAPVPELLGRLGERVVAIHVKDGDGSLDPSRQVAVGSGVLPIEDILAAAPDALRVVELDDTVGDPFEAVALSRQYLTGPG